jgi:uncharacterized protein (TIGR02466 family)
MRKINNLFVTPVLEAILPEVDNNELITNIHTVFDKSNVNRVLSHLWYQNIETKSKSNYGYSSFNDPNGNLIHNPNFNKFFNQLENLITDFFKQLGFTGSWEYLNSWAAVYPTGAYVARHNHGDVHWSGCYYVKVPDSSSEIVFDDPKEYSLTNEPEGFTNRGMKMASFSPCDGKLLLWPGFVKHSTLPNQSSEDRIIISFNINCHE